MSNAGECLVFQYDRAWTMFRAIIDRIPDAQWRTATEPNLVPARWALHVVSTADFYSRPSPEGFRFDEPLGSDWEEDASKLPDKTQILGYLAEVEARTRAWLTALSDEEMAAPSGFCWTGGSVLEQNLYQLRHTMFHTGELSMILRFGGAEETEWE